MVKEATEHTFVFKRLKDKNLLVGVSILNNLLSAD